MKIKIEIGRQGNFIFALLLIYFVFFGYICNVYEKNVGDGVLFLYKIIFSPVSILSGIILFVIVFIMVLRENFFEYGIRNSIWLIPFIIVMSWIWYWFLYGFDFGMIGFYFIRFESYLTILTLLGINLLAALTASIVKEKYSRFITEVKLIET
jgi:apolipoprotein N-acyltransferase